MPDSGEMSVAKSRPLPRSTFLVELAGLVLTIAGTLAVLAFVMKLWRADLQIPLAYSGDGIFTQAAIKSIIETGWYLETPNLGAPFGQQLYDFPAAGDLLNLLLVKVFALVLRDSSLLMNLFFMATFLLDAMTAYFALRLLRVRVTWAVVFAIVFAILPYHFYHGAYHLWLSAYYAVPLGCVLLVRQFDSPFPAVSPGSSWITRENALAITTCVLLGSTGLYYGFFIAGLLVVVGLIRIPDDHGRTLLSSFVLSGVIGAVLLVGLVPSFIYGLQHGANDQVAHRIPAEAEIFGLKPIQLIAPIPAHRIGFLADLGQKIRDTPEPSETGQNLGVIGSFGLLALIVRAFRRVTNGRSASLEWSYFDRMGFLSLVAILTATSAGLSLGLSVLGLSQIRAWNRIAIVIGFFSVAAAALLVQRVGRSWRPTPIINVFRVAAGTLLVAVAVFDQTVPYGTNPTYVAAFESDRAFVQRVEERLGPGASVFQLPFVPFPESAPPARMTDYDHMRAYLHSGTLNWSYGGVKGREADWQVPLLGQPVAAATSAGPTLRPGRSLPLSVVVERLAVVGFGGIYIDRFGYQDGGAALEQELRAILSAGPAVESGDGRLVLYDLQPVRTRVQGEMSPARLAAERELILHPILLRWGGGFFPEESSGAEAWRWAGQHASLTIINSLPRERSGTLTMSLETGSRDSSTVRLRWDGQLIETNASAERSLLRITLILPPGGTSIAFETDAPRVQAPDPRDLHLRVLDATFVEDGLPSSVETWDSSAFRGARDNVDAGGRVAAHIQIDGRAAVEGPAIPKAVVVVFDSQP